MNNRPIWIYYNSNLAMKLRAMKQKKSCRGLGVNNIFFCFVPLSLGAKLEFQDIEIGLSSLKNMTLNIDLEKKYNSP